MTHRNNFILSSEITIEIRSNISSRPFARRQSTVSDADDEASPRCRTRRKAFEIVPTTPQHQTSRFRTALKNSKTARSPPPPKETKKSTIPILQMQNNPQPAGPLSTAHSANASFHDTSGNDQEYLGWEQRYPRDVGHRTPEQSPGRRTCSPASDATDIEDTPQRPKWPLIQQDRQRLANVLRFSECDPFVDEPWMTLNGKRMHRNENCGGKQECEILRESLSIRSLGTTVIHRMNFQEKNTDWLED